MVYNAEKYLNKAITKLVITVPAYFSDAQRALTRQAAEALGLKVLRIINEPTAAALAYGFDEKQDHNSNILIFDLGGGTFDVSILSLNKDKEKNSTEFEVLGTSGDTNLGGEDFDKVLVELVLDKIKNQPDIVEQIKNNKQAMKRLKVACENTKKLLSISEEANICVNGIIENVDIIQIIGRNEFEKKCQPLFDKLFSPIEKALTMAKENKKNIIIDEVILVGGSTRIPKIKEIIREYFPQSKINDSINPDEAIAYGATIEAEKILYHQDDKIQNFSLLDITPFSLGTDVKNESKDPEVHKEGPLMDVIIKRGVHIPTSFSKTYATTSDNQKSMSIDIFEGEKKYIKYNHLLKKSNIDNLTPRPKGQTKVEMKFDIDVNGILNVEARELSNDNKGQVVNLVIKNDEVNLTKNEMEELRKKMVDLVGKFGEHNEGNNNDYINIKGVLKQYYDAFEKFKKDKGEDDDDNNDDGIIYITNYYTTLESFINKFDKNFDNETVLYKFYLYIKDLFLKYLEALKLGLDRGDKKHIFEKINDYIQIFINKSSGYLNELIEILSSLKKGKNKVNFFQIIAFVVKKLCEFGQTCIFSNKPFCKYHSIIYFEQSNSYYEKYFPKIKEDKGKDNKNNNPGIEGGNEKRENISFLPANEIESLNNAHKSCLNFLRDIKSGAILLCEEFLKKDELINENLILTADKGRGITAQQNLYNLDKMNRENQKIYLDNYEKLLSEIQVSKEFTKKEALCIANIIKINFFMSKTFSNKPRYLIYLARRCETIVEHLKLNKNEKWYLEFQDLYKKLKENEPTDQNYQEQLSEMKEKYPDVFRIIEDNFNTMSTKEFIKFIIKEHPYKYIEKDSDKNFDEDTPELLRFLLKKYLPDDYRPMESREDTVLRYCIVHEISKKLNYLYSSVN